MDVFLVRIKACLHMPFLIRFYRALQLFAGRKCTLTAISVRYLPRFPTNRRQAPPSFIWLRTCLKPLQYCGKKSLPNRTEIVSRQVDTCDFHRELDRDESCIKKVRQKLHKKSHHCVNWPLENNKNVLK